MRNKTRIKQKQQPEEDAVSLSTQNHTNQQRQQAQHHQALPQNQCQIALLNFWQREAWTISSGLLARAPVANPYLLILDETATYMNLQEKLAVADTNNEKNKTKNIISLTYKSPIVYKEL
jgi:ABC-type molybdenum transport system ATPase subunit/photorepair protein PhrA